LSAVGGNKSKLGGRKGPLCSKKGWGPSKQRSQKTGKKSGIEKKPPEKKVNDTERKSEGCSGSRGLRIWKKWGGRVKGNLSGQRSEKSRGRTERNSWRNPNVDSGKSDGNKPGGKRKSWQIRVKNSNNGKGRVKSQPKPRPQCHPGDDGKEETFPYVGEDQQY